MSTERKTEQIATMFNGPLYPCTLRSRCCITRNIRGNLNTHQCDIRGYTCLLASATIAAYRTSTMRAVTVSIHGVIIIVINIPTMIGEFRAAVPEMADKVEVVIVDTGIDNCHHHALASIA